MRTKLKRVTALVLIALMLLLLLPTGLASDAETISDPVIPGLVDGGVLLDAINTPTEQPIANDALTAHTVEFNIGADALDAGVVAPASVTVDDGNTITTLTAISWLDESGKAVKVFAGWYTDAELTNEFSTASAITANITLFAKWVDPDAEGRYYVNFYSQDGTTVHLTVSVDEGRTVNLLRLLLWKEKSSAAGLRRCRATRLYRQLTPSISVLPSAMQYRKTKKL
jgi:uncharacterized repeat protein (TIGR02543 family)